ncbi:MULTISPECIES: maleylacetate reductase [unclassified Mesorhizobium]|uniref:maleylacetate reductase n=3 Tax=Mesorhizobium TaxID=68287 RepID=UPI000FC9F6F4|nr:MULTISPECIES: maleylacetate reductase [unclassified Mesorhizobium]TIT77407.1 MAG: iron-containing alcohol dehydrogenase [Mesorhizobium sp.]TGP22236.1 maleylacetate reductase [Mesorhizobium sp. M1D.F.Ca.ET.231.01.1.1]TGP25519.1 maleylacetate reductase [Mesorhizobium sp. M1D.F.Ca.ET.234.01.1.1]TGS38530.1 maleylacetate reductase [Mesorhizobium sp. M1D.F.Ca.ET.184.01.1.1]TGS58487.1 maleylacetate reductase [Mesorhizobium sp. M1D.F.Ca.ET.183.01.1.1]
MTRNFTYQGSSARIIFGNGASMQTAEHVEALNCRRALVLSTPQQATDAEALAERLGALCVGTFSGATMHTPVEVTERAVAEAAKFRADCVVSLGGGSTTGLGKAIAYRTDIAQVVIPTTYAGSEVTPILGQTEGGAKTTLRSPKVLPELVIYDPELTLGLPVGISVTSGLNAIAHAAEGLYAEDRNPITSMMATEGMRALKEALPVIVVSPREADARAKALYGAWLCGTVLGQVAMALHHKICHTLGGSFDTPHAETHAIMLPYTIGFNAAAVPDLLRPVADIFGGSPGQAFYDFAKTIGAPQALKDFGLKESDLDRAAEIATKSPYPNPRPFDRASIRSLLQSAWQGDRPPH